MPGNDRRLAVGYVEALKRAGVECVLVVVTARLKRARSFRHEPTGMLVRSLPCRPAYRGHRRFIADPYARTGRDMFGVSSPWLGPIAGFARPLVPYLNTPIVRLARELRSQKCDAILCQECEFSRFDCLTSTPMGQVEVIA